MGIGYSRQKRCVGLVPYHFVVAFQREDYVGDPAYQYHEISFVAEADPGIHPATNPLDAGCTHNVFIHVQTSNDGEDWTTVYNCNSNPLVPGGQKHITVSLSGRYMRVLVYSLGTGRVDFTIGDPEDQVLPNFIQPTGPACSTWCEIDCETGSETTGEELFGE